MDDSRWFVAEIAISSRCSRPTSPLETVESMKSTVTSTLRKEGSIITQILLKEKLRDAQRIINLRFVFTLSKSLNALNGMLEEHNVKSPLVLVHTVQGHTHKVDNENTIHKLTR